MTTTTETYGFGVRNRPPALAREPFSPLPETLARNLELGLSLIAKPFVGMTTDGSATSGLYPVRSTGVSTKPIVDAAQAFLATLDEGQRATLSMPLDSQEWQRWNNTHPFLLRHGLCLEKMNEAQRGACLEVLRASLSARGFDLARDIMKLNYHIGEITEHWDEYGEWLYWFSLFGTPSADQPWGWQIDGHHLIVNFLVVGDQVTMTPTFMGSEPVFADFGPYAGTRVFRAEEQGGLDLINSLPDAQRDRAILYPSILTTDLPQERWHPTEGRIVGRAFHDNLVLAQEGLRCNDLGAGQRDKLLGVIETFVGRLRAGHDQVRMDEVKRHLEETHLVWMGGTGDDSVFYYRIYSPVIFIEFDHERGIAFDNDEPERLHVHTVLRTPNGNDYGKDLLKQHYALHHGTAAPGRLS